MAIVAGFDVPRAQLTFGALDTGTGEIHRGRRRAEPGAVRAWVAEFAGAQVDVAVEAWTGWVLVCEALWAAGAGAPVAEPAQASAWRGSKRHAQSDRADTRWLRRLLCEGRLPEAWIVPAPVREWRTRTRLGKTLVEERPGWLPRLQATLFSSRPRQCRRPAAGSQRARVAAHARAAARRRGADRDRAGDHR